MSVVSNPRQLPPSRSRRLRVVSATVAVLALGGLVGVGPLGVMPTAEAATAASSQLTVKWAGDASSAASYQPGRLSTSPHYSELKNIAITVSQTAGIIDQSIRVGVTGFAGTKSSTATGVTASNAKNYLQAMQCWGSNPAAVDFNQTCQWGGRFSVDNNGLGDSVIPDNASRVGPLDLDPSNPSSHDVPFRTVDGQTVSGKPHLVKGVSTYDILDYFSPSTTNEVTSARVSVDGTGFFDFETQTSDQAPQLGCGTSAHLRCWLVVVPRGTVFGGDGDQCSGIRDPANNFDLYSRGRPNSIQGGSPVNDKCDYWNNRIVVPLDFTPTGNTCPVGGTEVRVIGSQLMVSAMSSWQPALCQTVKSTFSFSTNPDSVARAQVIETGTNTPNIEYSGFPVSAGELLTDSERQVLAKTRLIYAPVAISSVVIAFLAEFDGGRQEKLNISPRIMAKILTQSYTFLVPSNSSDPAKNVAHLGAANRRFSYLNQDPEFRALNPDNWYQFTSNPAVVLPGPSGADAIRQVWRWVTADTDARAFLAGTPDPSGMTVNPYYLPEGDPKAVVPWYLDSQPKYLETPVQRAVGLSNIDGTPEKIADANLDMFPKDDESLVPLRIVPVAQGGAGEKSRFDSIQFSPYTDNLLTAARQAFRANPNSKTVWDGTKLNAAGESGDWVSSGTQLPGAKFMIAITDSPSAGRYGLSTAAIEVPNSSSLVKPDIAGMTSALSALQATSLDSVKQIDPSKVPVGGYPMTMVTYAGVNVSKASTTARTTIASMINQISSSGQVTGTAVGELPAGYLPLTTGLQAQANTAALAIQAYFAPTTATATTPAHGIAQDSSGSSATGATLATLPDSANPTMSTGVDSSVTGKTEPSPDEPVARSGIAISLGVGLAGVLLAPLLFRGRGFF